MPQLKYVVFIFFVLCSFTAWASIAATAHWNVRTDGANTNGGFFDPAVASPGTDYSAQAAAQLSFANILSWGTNKHIYEFGPSGNCGVSWQWVVYLGRGQDARLDGMRFFPNLASPIR